MQLQNIWLVTGSLREATYFNESDEPKAWLCKIWIRSSQILSHRSMNKILNNLLHILVLKSEWSLSLTILRLKSTRWANTNTDRKGSTACGVTCPSVTCPKGEYPKSCLTRTPVLAWGKGTQVLSWRGGTQSCLGQGGHHRTGVPHLALAGTGVPVLPVLGYPHWKDMGPVVGSIMGWRWGILQC